MLFLLFVFNSTLAFSFPVHLTAIEVQYPYQSDTEWQCFSTSQIKKLECREWVDDDKRAEEHSDLDLVIEADTEIHKYALNNANSVCSEIRQDFLDLLRGQKFFCILGNPLGILEPNLFFTQSKPKMSWVYQCLKTLLGQVAWHGGFGFCVDD